MSEQQFILCPVPNSVHYCELGYMLAKCPKCAAVGSKEIFIINIRHMDIGHKDGIFLYGLLSSTTMMVNTCVAAI